MIRVEETAIIDKPVAEVWSLLREFNNHDRWHPAVASSHMRAGDPQDRVGGVRDFRLVSGEHVCEQLLRLSDQKRSFSYAITESDLPLENYVAHVELKPVTNGNQTFWRWYSRFSVPAGKESEYRKLVGEGVYRSGFEGARQYLHAKAKTSTGYRQTASAAASVETTDYRTASYRTAGYTTTSKQNAGQKNASTIDQSAVANVLEGEAVRVERYGDADVLNCVSVAALPPAANEVRIKQQVIGVNYIDVYTRSGYFNLIDPPAVPGMEAAGTVVDCGSSVTHLKPGDRVVYACAPPGAYCTVRTMNAELVVPLPDHVDQRTAASVMLKGVTAWFLLNKVHELKRGDTALVYAPVGGVGHLLVQWASAIGARVIGATSSNKKAQLAREAGADTVLVPGNKSLEQQVYEATDGVGVDVVFDAVGRDSFDHSIASLRPCGHLVSYGQASGDIGAKDIGGLAANSLTLSRPNYSHYTDTQEKITQASNAVWDALLSGTISVTIGQTYDLHDAASAHRAIESRQTTGSTLLLSNAVME